MNIYNLVVNIYFDLSDLYCLGMATDLSQSLGLSIYRYKDYIMLISTADRIDLVFYCLLMIADRCKDDIGSKINDTSSAAGRVAIVYGLTAIFLSLFLVDCRIKSTGTLTNLEGKLFGPALELSRSPRPRVFRTNTLLARLVGQSPSTTFS